MAALIRHHGDERQRPWRQIMMGRIRAGFWSLLPRLRDGVRHIEQGTLLDAVFDLEESPVHSILRVFVAKDAFDIGLHPGQHGPSRPAEWIAEYQRRSIAHDLAEVIVWCRRFIVLDYGEGIQTEMRPTIGVRYHGQVVTTHLGIDLELSPFRPAVLGLGSVTTLLGSRMGESRCIACSVSKSRRRGALDDISYIRRLRRQGAGRGRRGGGGRGSGRNGHLRRARLKGRTIHCCKSRRSAWSGSCRRRFRGGSTSLCRCRRRSNRKGCPSTGQGNR